MKSKFKMISSILILLLTILLIAVLIGYYNEPVEVIQPNIDNLAEANRDIDKVISENISGDIITDSIQKISGEESVLDSGDTKLNESIIINAIDKSEAENQTEKDKAVIITSEDTMTNKEKREILTELDNTLMDLLDVVDKVQTVDESRLVTEEGEVQE